MFGLILDKVFVQLADFPETLPGYGFHLLVDGGDAFILEFCYFRLGISLEQIRQHPGLLAGQPPEQEIQEKPERREARLCVKIFCFG
jgi:hypothetical protein